MLTTTLKIILWLTTTISITLNLNPNGPIHQNYSISCVMEIIQHQFTTTTSNKLLTIIITPNMSVTAHEIQNKITKKINHLLNWNVVIINGNDMLIQFEPSEICLNCPVENEPQLLKHISQPKHKSVFGLMIVDNLEMFLEKFHDFRQKPTHNYGVFFLVHVSEISQSYRKIAEAVLRELLRFKIVNSAVIIPKNSLTRFDVYGLKVFEGSGVCGNSPKLVLMDSCKKGRMKDNKKLFGDKVPLTFNNCSINTIAMAYPPFVIDAHNGFEINVLKELGKILHIHFDLVLENTTSDWGARSSKNNWTGPLQNVYETSAIAVGNIVADPDLIQDFGSSVNYFYEHMVWVVPIALPIPRWKNIFVIFEYELWLVCVGYFVLTALLFQATSTGDELGSFKQLGTNFMTSLRVLIGIASPQQPKTMLVRAIFMSLTTYSMVLVVLYQSILVTNLTNPVYEHQISTVGDILRSGNGIGGLENYRKFFDDSTDKRTMLIYDMFEVYDEVNNTAYNWILTVAQDRDTCTVSSSFYVNFLLSKHDEAVTTVHDEPKIFVLKKILFAYPICMVLPKGFPLTKKFDQIIWRLLSGGLILQWAKSYQNKHFTNTTSSEDDHDVGDDTQITLEHFTGAFDLLLLGYTFGSASLILEILLAKISKTKKFARLQKHFKAALRETKKTFHKLIQ